MNFVSYVVCHNLTCTSIEIFLSHSPVFLKIVDQLFMVIVYILTIICFLLINIYLFDIFFFDFGYGLNGLFDLLRLQGFHKNEIFSIFSWNNIVYFLVHKIYLTHLGSVEHGWDLGFVYLRGWIEEGKGSTVGNKKKERGRLTGRKERKE